VLLGQTAFVDNRGGATGVIGGDFVAHSAPDGYTIMYSPGNDLSLRQVLLKVNPVDPTKDYSPIVATVKATNLIAAHPSAPFNTAKEFIEYAKKNPGKLSYSTPGVGSHFHFAGALLQMHGIDMVHVPFKGGGPAVQATLAGEPLLTLGNLASMYSLIREKRLKSVALIEKKPIPNDPTATLGEVLPGYEMPDA
jgi:tripartite-type tricarboxylate transporter receptor subunit TctC